MLCYLFSNHLATTEVRRGFRFSFKRDELNTQERNFKTIDNMFPKGHARRWMRIIHVGAVKSTASIHGLVYDVEVIGNAIDMENNKYNNTKNELFVWLRELVRVPIFIQQNLVLAQSFIRSRSSYVPGISSPNLLYTIECWSSGTLVQWYIV